MIGDTVSLLVAAWRFARFSDFAPPEIVVSLSLSRSFSYPQFVLTMCFETCLHKKCVIVKNCFVVKGIARDVALGLHIEFKTNGFGYGHSSRKNISGHRSECAL